MKICRVGRRAEKEATSSSNYRRRRGMGS